MTKLQGRHNLRISSFQSLATAQTVLGSWNTPTTAGCSCLLMLKRQLKGAAQGQWHGKMISEHHNQLLAQGPRKLQYHTLRKQKTPKQALATSGQLKTTLPMNPFLPLNSIHFDCKIWTWMENRYCTFKVMMNSSKPLKEVTKLLFLYYFILPYWCVQRSSQLSVFIFVSSHLKAFWNFIRFFTP